MSNGTCEACIICYRLQPALHSETIPGERDLPFKQPATISQKLAGIFGRTTGVPAISESSLPPMNGLRKGPPPEHLLTRLSRTETGQDLVVRTREADILISLENSQALHGEASQSHFCRVIQINNSLPEDEQLLALTGEMSRVLLARDNLVPTHSHTSLARIQISRLVNGHMMATCAQIADEFHRIGDGGPRQVFALCHPGIMKAYDHSRDSHPDAGTNGAAMAAAFMAFYQDRDRLAEDEVREIAYLERLQDNILTDIRNFCQPYNGQQAGETTFARALLSVVDYPREFYRASQDALRQKIRRSPPPLHDGKADLIKLVNARGMRYINTFFPDFMPTDNIHGSVMPQTAERIRNLDAKRSPLYRQFRRASAIPVHLAETASHPATATLSS
ncbi:MAG TPA: hypothetical protein DCW68_07350 [Rhodospirillaceae bacterium]|nr:MAG: hypothetical protein A2018_06860 [Alphaproteobacteria bacterium GWF2_58_20]HAU29902.1 hypothetical protein [Rhodospirillaceae bacterium]